MSESILFKDFSPHGSTGPEDSDFLYSCYLDGPQGMRFELLKQAHHTEEDVKKAKQWLRSNHDVVGIYVIKEKVI